MSSYLNSLLEKKRWVFILLLALVVISKAPFANLPVFWDERSHMYNSLIAAENNLNPFVAWVHAYRPPFVTMLVALAYKLFGFSLIAPRLSIILFSWIALCFTFLIGKELYGKEAGFWSALLLFSCPMFFAQSGLYQFAVPVTALTVSTLYCYIKDRKIMYIISAGLLLLTREDGILVIMSIAVFEILLNLPKVFKKSNDITIFHKIKTVGFKTLFYAFPLIFFGGWILCNKLLLGWFLLPSHTKTLVNFQFYFKDIEPILYNFFWVHFRYLISIAIGLAALFSIFIPGFRKKFLNKEFLFFIMLTSVTTLFYMWVEATREAYGPTAVLPRYILFLYPAFFIFGAGAICQLFKNRPEQVIIFITIISLFVTCWFIPDKGWAGERNLTHWHIIKVHKETDEFLERNFSSSAIITTWPVFQQLTEAKLGYVTKEFEEIYDLTPVPWSAPWTISELVEYIKAKRLSGTKTDNIILVIPSTKPLHTGIPCKEFDRFRKERGNKGLIKLFQSGPAKVWVYLYE